MATATKGELHFQRPPGRLYGFIQTGAFYQFIGALQQPSRQRRVKLKPLKNLRPSGPSTLKPQRGLSIRCQPSKGEMQEWYMKKRLLSVKKRLFINPQRPKGSLGTCEPFQRPKGDDGRAPIVFIPLFHWFSFSSGLHTTRSTCPFCELIPRDFRIPEGVRGRGHRCSPHFSQWRGGGL